MHSYFWTVFEDEKEEEGVSIKFFAPWTDLYRTPGIRLAFVQSFLNEVFLGLRLKLWMPEVEIISKQETVLLLKF